MEYDIVVNSDSDVLLKMMNDNPIRQLSLISRDSSLAGDTIGKIAVISNCLDVMEKKTNVAYDVVLDLDITSPLRRVSDIESILSKHFDMKPDVTTSVVPARRNPYFNLLMQADKGMRKVIDSNFTAR